MGTEKPSTIQPACADSEAPSVAIAEFTPITEPVPPLGPVERAKAKPRPHRKKKPAEPPPAAKKVWVIDSPYRTIFAGPHPYGGSER